MSPLLERARLLFECGRPEAAAETILLALGADPMDHAARLLLALCLARAGHLEPARGHAAAVVGARPHDAHALSTLASILFHQGRLAEAGAAARRAVDLRPDLDDTWALLGSIHLTRGDPASALSAADGGLAAEGRNVRCMNVRGLALLQMGAAAEADATLRAALAIEPLSGLTHANLGWVRLRCGDRTEAAAHFVEALRLAPHLHSARAGLEATRAA
jgi:tetratricopeptide (TPR) repeat protein